MKKFNTIAVLGSGVMGSQIAAVFANASIKVYLFDNNNYAKDNIKKLITLKPEPLTTNANLSFIEPCCYDNDLAKLAQCDLIIEAIIEDLDAKNELFNKIKPYLQKEVIVASNTSSLAINELAKIFNDEISFCGVHFFNPPRYMSLVELITGNTTNAVLDDLENFLVSELGKNIIYAKDNTGFVANRIGVFALASVMYHSEVFNISFAQADTLTGKLLHRSKSASFRTADLVGLDILIAVFRGFYNNHKTDPWRDYFIVPEYLENLVANGSLGQKTKIGIYKKQGDEIFVFNKTSKDYQKADYKIDTSVKKILTNTPIKEQFKALTHNNHKQAKFLVAIIKDLCLYSAYHLENIAKTPLDIDLALRWGYGWQLGIFAYWQQNDVAKTLAYFKKESKNELIASWLNDCNNFYKDDKVWLPNANKWTALAINSAYQYHLYRPQLLNNWQKQDLGITIFEDNSLRLWHDGDGIAIVNFKTKMSVLSYSLIKSLDKVITIAQNDYKALIIWQLEPTFCAGANLYEIYAGVKLGKITSNNIISKVGGNILHILKPQLPDVSDLPAISEVIDLLQRTLRRLKFSNIPTIAAVNGLALGGGCELLLHCDLRVVAVESYIGLVEAGVGLLPAGGGLTQMALRADKYTKGDDLLPIISKYFEQIALAKVANNAYQAREMAYLDDNDLIVAHPDALLYFAKQSAKLLAANNYRPPEDKAIRIAGNGIYADFLAQLTNMRIGGFISTHDEKIAQAIAKVLTVGELAEGMKVDAQCLLNLEKTVFLELLANKKTQDRIENMLVNNKPLRN